MDTESNLDIRKVAPVGVAVFVVLVFTCCIINMVTRKKRRAQAQRPYPQRVPPPPPNRASAPVTEMNPVTISDARPPGQPPQPHWRETRVPTQFQPNNRYQVPLPTHDHTRPYPTAPPLDTPTAPPTTYRPASFHVIYSSQQQQQGQQQAPAQAQFNTEDLLSFEATGDDKSLPCPICLGPLEEEPISTGQCLHLMHTSCLKDWLAKDARSACPVCRLPYSDELQTGHTPHNIAPELRGTVGPP